MGGLSKIHLESSLPTSQSKPYSKPSLGMGGLSNINLTSNIHSLSKKSPAHAYSGMGGLSRMQVPSEVKSQPQERSTMGGLSRIHLESKVNFGQKKGRFWEKKGLICRCCPGRFADGGLESNARRVDVREVDREAPAQAEQLEQLEGNLFLAVDGLFPERVERGLQNGRDQPQEIRELALGYQILRPVHKKPP